MVGNQQNISEKIVEEEKQQQIQINIEDQQPEDNEDEESEEFGNSLFSFNFLNDEGPRQVEQVDK